MTQVAESRCPPVAVSYVFVASRRSSPNCFDDEALEFPWALGEYLGVQCFSKVAFVKTAVSADGEACPVCLKLRPFVLVSRQPEDTGKDTRLHRLCGRTRMC